MNEVYLRWMLKQIQLEYVEIGRNKHLCQRGDGLERKKRRIGAPKGLVRVTFGKVGWASGL